MTCSFKEYIEERFINLLPGDEAEKAKYAPEVHAMLQKAYAPIGGIKGTGFKDHQDMIDNIPMWKLYRHEGQIKAVKLYKNNSVNGRKSVATATDGSLAGKKGLIKMATADMTQKRSYGEVSKAALKMAKNIVPDFESHVIPRDKIEGIAQGEEIRDVSHDDPEIVKNPELAKHFYQRKIGDEWQTKLMVGTPGKKITPRK